MEYTLDQIEYLDALMSSIDVDFYGKQCHFIQDLIPTKRMEIYSRDACKNVSLRDVCKWYINKMGEDDDIDEGYLSDKIADFFSFIAFVSSTGYIID